MGHDSSPSLSLDEAPALLRFVASRSSGETSALLSLPTSARSLLVLAHGAGAGIDHPFMRDLSAALGRHEVATFRYNFPYAEHGRRRPDPTAVCTATVRSALATARGHTPGLPLFAGGKSFGGRMTSTAAAHESLTDVRGLVFFGFPLHPIGRPSVERGDHLDDVDVPMLFLQGTRDRLAEMDLVESVCDRVGDRATLHVVDGADHGFHVLKRSGRTDTEVLDELAATTAAWIMETL